MLDLLRGVSANQAADQKPVKSKTLGLDMSTSLSLGFPSLQTCQTTFIICFYLLYLSPTLKMHILLFSHTKTGIIYLPSQLYCMCSLSRGFQRTLPLQFQSPTTSLSLLCYLVHLPSSLFSRFLVWLRTTAEQATKLQPQQTSGGEQHWTHILCKTHTVTSASTLGNISVSSDIR